MIEEAAGTRMFETKKTAALKTIEKKDNKLAEINKVIEEDITPTLKKLRKERSSYLEYQKTKVGCGWLAHIRTSHSHARGAPFPPFPFPFPFPNNRWSSST